MQRGRDVVLCRQILSEGGVIAYPTDTVYGLGADILQWKAVEKIGLIKGGRKDKNYLLNIGSLQQLYPYIKILSEVEKKLIKCFWPGALSIVFPAATALPDYLVGEGGTIGIRMPSNQMALEMLKDYPCPIISTSVNRSGAMPILTGGQIEEFCGNNVDYILESADPCSGLPSTIVRVIDGRIKILRPGACDNLLQERFKNLMDKT